MKTALVTGASRGIGAAIAKALAKDGCLVTVNFNREEALARLVADECGGRCIKADVSQLRQVNQMYDEIGGVDVLVCNAGISEYGLFSETDYEAWRRVFAVNVDGVYNCIQRALPYMIRQKRGVILIISSVWGICGASCEAAYSASKAALVGLTKSLAKELGPSGIRVNCIAPGVIDTDMVHGFGESDRRNLEERTPLQRLGKPGDVAGLASFLASDAASFITGQIISVDGGFGI